MQSSGETPLFQHLYIFISAIGTEFLFYLPGAVPIPILPCESYRHQNNASFCLLLCYCYHSYLPVTMQELIAVPCPCPCGVSCLGHFFSFPMEDNKIQQDFIYFVMTIHSLSGFF